MFDNSCMIPPQGVDRRGRTVTRGGKELTVIGSIKSSAWHPKVKAHRASQILSSKLISRVSRYSAR